MADACFVSGGAASCAGRVSARYCVQQIVVGVVGVKEPVAVPPVGAHSPPEGLEVP